MKINKDAIMAVLQVVFRAAGGHNSNLETDIADIRSGHGCTGEPIIMTPALAQAVAEAEELVAAERQGKIDGIRRMYRVDLCGSYERRGSEFGDRDHRTKLQRTEKDRRSVPRTEGPERRTGERRQKGRRPLDKPYGQTGWEEYK